MSSFRSWFAWLALAIITLLVACGGPSQGPSANVAPVAIDTPDAGGHRGVNVGQPAQPPANALDATSVVPVLATDPVRGERSALVTVVMFSDFQCPFCARVEPTVQQVLETYPRDVRLVWKNYPLPFHERAQPTAELAAGIFAKFGEERFWAFHDQIYAVEGKPRDLSRNALEQYARTAVGSTVNIDELIRLGHSKVEEDLATVKKVGVNGTPGFYINGTQLSGAQPFEKFKAAIDNELAEARTAVKNGLAADRVYVTRSAANYKARRPNDDDDEPAAEDKTVFKVNVGKAPARGPADALVTIVVFSDFECPFCKRVEPTLEQVNRDYAGKVRLVWKNEPLPFHKRARPAAEFAAEIRAQKGDSAFWNVHDKLFAAQPTLDDQTLENIAREVGANPTSVMAAVKAEKHKKEIEADMDQADDLRASGTPHFFVNGRRLVGAQPFEKFKAVIDEELVKAEALVKNGTPKAKVYEAILATAKDTRVAVTASANAPSKGAANAKLTLHQFSDFQCPFCRRVEPNLDDIMKKYAGKLRIVWHDMPLAFHQDAPLAAQAAREAYAQKGNAGFWKMHDKLFEKQGETDGLKRPALDSYAQDMGLDMVKWQKALDSGTHKQLVDDDAKAAAAAGLTGTPAFVLDGRVISGAQPVENFARAIDRALAH